MKNPKEDNLPTRQSLINRLKNWQDQNTWQEFFDTYWKLIYGMAHKAGLSDAEAQDVVQETLISVAKHMPEFKYDPAIGSFKAWLGTMTRWRIIDQVRKRLPQVHLPSSNTDTTGWAEANIATPEDKGFEALWDADWKDNLLAIAKEKVKRRINPQKYQIYHFNVTREWPAEKVAAHFGIPVAQVHLAKHRVGESIAAELERLHRDWI